VFFDREEARAFLASAEFPIVFKADHGSSARGITVCRTAREARQLVDACFGRGRIIHRGDPRDRAWGYVICQEYLPNVNEWRLVRIGDSYFCRFKERKGEFHSGSGSVRWAAAPRHLLDLLRRLTEASGFTSMNADIFETSDGRFLVNELHAVFGDIDPGNRERGREHMGRYRWDAAAGEWVFESGYFYDNGCANLRVEEVIRNLETRNVERGR
jgi:glutathione synthase/RimK-type ligase-like ATP-grasp enzyme